MKDLLSRDAFRRKEPEDSNALEVIPEPEVTATPLELGDPRVPRGARTVGSFAEKHDWIVRPTYARGPWMHTARWTVLRIAESVALRMRHPDGRRAVAVWMTQTDPTEWKLESSWILDPHWREVKMADLKAFLGRVEA